MSYVLKKGSKTIGQGPSVGALKGIAETKAVLELSSRDLPSVDLEWRDEVLYVCPNGVSRWSRTDWSVTPA